MDLELTIPPSRGAKEINAVAEYRRDLDSIDILRLGDASLSSETPQIKQLRTSHHELAQLLAKGIKPVQASLITGYSQSRISILQKDPAFRELLAYYGEISEQVHVDVLQRAKALGIDILEELHQRITESPETVTNMELIKAAELTLDRSGYGPKATVKVEHGIAADTLEAIKRAEDEKAKGNVIEANSDRRTSVSGGDQRPVIRYEKAETLIVGPEGNAVPAESGKMAESPAPGERGVEV